MPDWDAIIEQVAAEPKSVSVDGQSVTNHDLSDLLDARDNDNTNTAIEQKQRGLRFTKLSPPGSA
jgi:hypothetical protein